MPMSCRSGCGACCIAPSISSPIPGMPHGKPAGVRCVQLTEDYRCAVFGKPERPDVCARLRPAFEMCGVDRDEAMTLLGAMEEATSPLVSPLPLAGEVGRSAGEGGRSQDFRSVVSSLPSP